MWKWIGGVCLGFVAAVVVAIVLYWFAMPRRNDLADLERWKIDPSITLPEDYLVMSQYLQVPSDLSDDEIDWMIEGLFREEDKYFKCDRLEIVGERAVPKLVEALSDQRIGKVRRGEGSQSPLYKIVSLLKPYSPPEAAAPLIRLADHSDPKVRAMVAEALGNIGTEECTAAVIELLADGEKQVRFDAVSGIGEGIKSGKASPEFLQVIFTPVVKSRKTQRPFFGFEARVLLEIDQDRAMAILLEVPDFWTHNPDLGSLLEVMNDQKVKVPLDHLLPLLKQLQTIDFQQQHPNPYGASLKLYARNPDANAEELIQKEVHSENDLVRYAAIESTGILAGIIDPPSHTYKLLQDHKFEELTKPQQYCAITENYGIHVVNGGHNQLFQAFSGQDCALTIEAFKAMGANKSADVLTQAAKLVGVDFTDPYPVDEPADNLSEGDLEELHRLDDRFEELESSEEENYPLVVRYAIEHKEDFQDEPATKKDSP